MKDPLVTYTRKKFAKPGPLESLERKGLKDYCEMCGATEAKARNHDDGTAALEPAFNPSGKPKTLCRDCRIGSAELLAAKREKLEEFVSLVARMKTEEEFGDDCPPSEDWISTLNELIASARKVSA
jgi:hypothetical protein